MKDKLKIAMAKANLDQWHTEMRQNDDCFGIFVCLLERLAKEIGKEKELNESVEFTFQRGEVLMLTLAVQDYIERTYMEKKNEN